MTDERDPAWAPLDPTLDPERWEGMVRGIVDRAAPILAGPGAAYAASPREPETGATASAIGLGDALGYPAPVTEWVATGQTPTIEELVVAMEERNR